MKILWLCDTVLSDPIMVKSQSWIHVLSHEIAKNSNIELVSITRGNVDEVQKKSDRNITQYVFPFDTSSSYGLPRIHTLNKIISVINEIKPDLIHYWGTENFWGLLHAEKMIDFPSLLEIQGLRYLWAEVFLGGMNTLDLLKAHGIKELLKPSSSILYQKRAFKKWGSSEIEIIRSFGDISVQSEWVKNEIYKVNPSTRIHSSKILLRKEFVESNVWNINNIRRNRIFVSATTGSIPYKGFHRIIDAAAHLKKDFPDLELAIAGHIQSGIRESGYQKWIRKKIEKYNLTDNVIWLGPLTVKNLIEELLKSHLCAVPSFIESYSLALEEALTLGIPSVASNTSALPELANRQKSAILFNPSNTKNIVDVISSVLNNDDLAVSLSKNSISTRRNYQKNLDPNFQIEIYENILSERHN